jgi:hypothetical protein
MVALGRANSRMKDFHNIWILMAERRRARRIMALLQERESRDEHGLGRHLRITLPWKEHDTRLQYVLFIHWLFSTLEGRACSAKLAETRALEIRLAEALKRCELP